MTRRFDVVAFDADDTLWHSEDTFHVAAKRIHELVAPYVPVGVDFEEAVAATERRNVTISGYGVKPWILSVIEAAVAVTHGTVPSAAIGEIVDIGHELLMEPVRLIDHVPEVLEEVGRTHRMIVVTKGDLVHQERKITTSGIDHHFERVHVVAEKDTDLYRRIVTELGVDPERLCMVGNSVRSDILPVLAIGGYAVHIPYPLTWFMEHVEHDGHVDELESIAELPAWLAGDVSK